MFCGSYPSRKDGWLLVDDADAFRVHQMKKKKRRKKRTISSDVEGGRDLNEFDY